jgi:hypothetical protein
LLQIVTDCYRLLKFVLECCRLLQLVTDCCTDCYRLLQIVAAFYRLLQVLTDCYRLLQVITDCYRLLQIVADCYRLLQIVAGRLLQIVTSCYKLLLSIQLSFVWWNSHHFNHYAHTLQKHVETAYEGFRTSPEFTGSLQSPGWYPPNPRWSILGHSRPLHPDSDCLVMSELSNCHDVFWLRFEEFWYITSRYCGFGQVESIWSCYIPPGGPVGNFPEMPSTPVIVQRTLIITMRPCDLGSVQIHRPGVNVFQFQIPSDPIFSQTKLLGTHEQREAQQF